MTHSNTSIKHTTTGGMAAATNDGQRQILSRLARLGMARRGRIAGQQLEAFALTSEAWAAIEALLGQADAGATTRSYAAARRLFAGWWVLVFARPFVFPVPPEAIAQFIADFTDIDGIPRSDDAQWVDQQLVEAGLKRNVGPIRYRTLKQRIAAICRWHQDAQEPSPMAHPLVRNAMRAAKRLADDDGTLRPRKRQGLRRAMLQDVLATCGEDREGIRDRALLLFAWSSGGRRPSEVAAADIRQLKRMEHGEGFVYFLHRSKTLKPGAKARQLPVTGIAAAAMERWLSLRSTLDEGVPSPSPRIFRAFRGPTAGYRLSAKAVGDIIARRCRQAGFEGNFGGHSARRGWVTEALRAGIPLADIMEMSTHTSAASVFEYDETSAVHNNPGANLAEA